MSRNILNSWFFSTSNANFKEEIFKNCKIYNLFSLKICTYGLFYCFTLQNPIYFFNFKNWMCTLHLLFFLNPSIFYSPSLASTFSFLFFTLYKFKHLQISNFLLSNSCIWFFKFPAATSHFSPYRIQNILNIVSHCGAASIHNLVKRLLSYVRADRLYAPKELLWW